jgi:hypothetical protein
VWYKGYLNRLSSLFLGKDLSTILLLSSYHCLYPCLRIHKSTLFNSYIFVLSFLHWSEWFTWVFMIIDILHSIIILALTWHISTQKLKSTRKLCLVQVHCSRIASEKGYLCIHFATKMCYNRHLDLIDVQMLCWSYTIFSAIIILCRRTLLNEMTLHLHSNIQSKESAAIILFP